MINEMGSGSPSVNAFKDLREQRQAERAARIEEAPDLRAESLSDGELKAHMGLYNRTLGHTGLLGGISGGFDWSKIFKPIDDDQKIKDATRPNPRDNDEARDIKDEYSKACREAKRERAFACRLARKLGNGVHHLSNGDVVEVKKGKDGQTTVTTRHPDGCTKTVTYDEGDPNKVTVRKTDQDGCEEVLTRNGTRISRRNRNGFGETETTYDVDRAGRPVRERRGPGRDDYERTRVNDDGSTDTRRLIYVDEDGENVYEDEHAEGRGKDWHETFTCRPPEPFPHPFPFPPFRPFQGR